MQPDVSHSLYMRKVAAMMGVHQHSCKGKSVSVELSRDTVTRQGRDTWSQDMVTIRS